MSIKKNYEVEMEKAPKCDICGAEAKYDAKTTTGQWGYLCPNCFMMYGVGLGLGKGQKIVIKK